MGRAMQRTHAWSWATMKGKRKQNLPKASEENKKETKDLQILQGRHKKCNEG